MTNLIKVTERIHILGRSVSRDEARKIWEELNNIFGYMGEPTLPYYPPGIRDWEVEPIPKEQPPIITYTDKTTITNKPFNNDMITWL